MSKESKENILGPAKPKEIGLYLLLGLSAGYSSKKISKAILFALGLTFLGLQGLQKLDIIQIKWCSLERIAKEKLDQDGDGSLTRKDVMILANRFVKNLASDIPSSAGFSLAFWAGFRYG
jgi:uncharacterized membrane protein (Fun14 family)